MESLSPVKIMSMSLAIEQKQLEAVTKNLSLTNQTFDNILSVESPQEVKVNNLPTIYQVIGGQTPLKVDYGIEDVDVDAKRSVVFEGGKTKFEYRPDVRIEEEMIKLGEATKAYEASIRLFNISKEITGHAAQIGRGRS